ncbi:fumarate reductase subunit D [Paenibacillus castaneae]|uniref:hypothetical protein n=1 Tax=Paenibacillus castaneae TaxID=474957 RepID=UPI000C9C095E|nr:hypothetical protein [Paenibacillus castaneae]NIK79568.1 fumarate reductase subunit D [Paenibacillus castaneae]
MNVWKGAWFLAKHELAKDRWKSLISLLIVGYLLLFTVPLFLDANSDETGSINWAMDFVYLTILPCLAFCFNQSMMRYWKNDAYTHKIAQWRTMPISSKQIAIGRLIQLTIVLFVTQLVFFSLQYLIVYMNDVNISIGYFALYGLLWFAYSLTIASMYVYWELGHTGKTYFIMNLLYILLYLILTLCLALLKIGNIVITSLHFIEDGNGWIVLVALAITALALFIGMKRIENRLEKRSYRA